MSAVDELITTLASDPLPVRPLRAPLQRAMLWLAGVGLLSGLVILAVGDIEQLLARYAGREAFMTLEMAAMLATGVLAIIAAFFAAIPGRSPRWLLAPLLPFAAWIVMSGAGCFRLWQLARARPIEPLRVALLGGLGSAALAAFILQFFHPFAVTFVDLALHLFAIALVVTATGMLNRRTLSPA